MTMGGGTGPGGIDRVFPEAVPRPGSNDPIGEAELKRRKEAKAPMTLLTNPVEAVAKAIYLDRYAKDGGKWEANESKEVWYAYARSAIAALTAPRDFDKAVEAVNRYLTPDDTDEQAKQTARGCVCAALPHLTGESELVAMVRELQDAEKAHQALLHTATWDVDDAVARLRKAERALLQWGSE